MKHVEEEGTLPGQDSFIDVICNMVGILIILVMVVGMRVSGVVESKTDAAASEEPTASLPRAPADPKELEKLRGELDETVRLASATHDEIGAAVVQAADLRQQSEVVDVQREQLSLMQAAVERDIERRRANLDAAGRQQFDVQRDIASTQIKLNELTQEQLALVSQPTTVEKIECVPTPIAKTVTGEEIHVRLRHGQLAVIPADELLQEFRRRGGDYLRSGLRDRDEAVDVYGPIDGFRLRLSVDRYEESSGDAVVPGTQKRSALVVQGVFLPTSDDIGQAVEQALLPGSALMQAVRGKRTASPAVTVWVYPDSYGALRTLKKAMWEAGVPMAVRPLADGQPIIFSTLGTRSAAE